MAIVSISGGGRATRPADMKADRLWLDQSEVPVADINLTQEDADALLAMEKHKADDTAYDYPSLGGGIRVPLLSPDKRETFFLDITRSQIKLTKGTYQNRARGVATSNTPLALPWPFRETPLNRNGLARIRRSGSREIRS